MQTTRPTRAKVAALAVAAVAAVAVTSLAPATSTQAGPGLPGSRVHATSTSAGLPG